MFARWGSLTFRHRWLVATVSLLAVLAAGVWGTGVFTSLSQGGYEPDGSDSTKVTALLDGTDLVDRPDVVLLYTAPQPGGIDDPALTAAVNTTIAALPAEHVAKTSSYWQVRAQLDQAAAAQAAAQAAGQPVPFDPAAHAQAQGALAALSDDDKTRGVVAITLQGADIAERLADFEAIRDSLDVEGATLQVGGFIPMGKSMNETATTDLAVAESVAIPLTLVLLVLVFGGFAAAALPVVTGALAILGSMGVLRVLSYSTEISAFALNMSILLGLGMAIDYSLFLVSRYREERAGGRGSEEAVRNTVATAGRTVVFSGTLLILALAGMLLFPQPFVRSLGYGGMASVAVAMLLALTVIPAALAILGERVHTRAGRWFSGSSGASPGYERLARAVMRRPVAVAAPILALLALMALPALNLQFGEFTEKSLPKDDPTRAVAQTLNTDFLDIASDGAVVVLQGGGGRPVAEDAVLAVAQQAAAVDHVTRVTVAGTEGDLTVLRATLDAVPGSEQAAGAIHDLREISAPDGAQLLVGGAEAQAVDAVDATTSTLPVMLLVIAAVTVVVLFLAFGSLTLPVKAVLMSMLSLGASLGVVVLVFQEGYGADLLGVTPAPLDVGVTVIIIAVLFGLSTDYEVFLVSRIAEARRGGMPTQDAIAHGVSHTGRIITTAGLLLMLVIGAFGISDIPFMRILAFGMVVALVIDATVVRLLLVPALMKLLGEANWWLPRPLEAVWRRFGISEGPAAPAPDPALVAAR